MSHACGPYTVDGFLVNKGPRARALFQGFVTLLETCGPVTPAPAKTRVAFMTRVRFASVNSLSDRALKAHFGLPYRLDSPRIEKIDFYPPGWYVHNFRVTRVEELDEELREWLCESRRLMGNQERFNRAE